MLCFIRFCFVQLLFVVQSERVFGLESKENKKKNMRTICFGPMTTMNDDVDKGVLKMSELVSTGLLSVM